MTAAETAAPDNLDAARQHAEIRLRVLADLRHAIHQIETGWSYVDAFRELTAAMAQHSAASAKIPKRRAQGPDPATRGEQGTPPFTRRDTAERRGSVLAPKRRIP